MAAEFLVCLKIYLDRRGVVRCDLEFPDALQPFRYYDGRSEGYMNAELWLDESSGVRFKLEYRPSVTQNAILADNDDNDFTSPETQKPEYSGPQIFATGVVKELYKLAMADGCVPVIGVKNYLVKFEVAGIKQEFPPIDAESFFI